ncbi:hypothetical protein AB852_09145 [Streptomyces uncialis]|uniref:Uncharacterized protein n=1 Tax=Streptomyces uncialis TaxID=1048205 RepID=A0A1Q4V9R0_9ACTN|nr:hypothetical protein AB852_09145 [Streptomyces uncialis]
MKETVAVALITASSTLLGGGLTALVAARTTSRQLAAQERLAQQSIDDQTAACRRQRRRDAYVSFLGQLDTVNRALWEIWTRPLPPDHRTVVDALYVMVWQLGDASNVLLLEGGAGGGGVRHG